MSWLRPLLALAIMSSVGITAPHAAGQGASEPSVLLYLGDSLTAGMGASYPSERGNGALVVRWWSNTSGAPLTLENLAVPGETTQTFIENGQRGRALAAIAHLAAENRLAAIVVSIGGNDLLQARDQPDANPAADAEPRVASILNDLRTAAGNAIPIVIFNLYAAHTGWESVSDADLRRLDAFNDAIHAAAEAAQARVADLHATFAGDVEQLTRYPYDFHPNNAGQLRIAEAVWQALGVDTGAPEISAPETYALTRSTPTIRFQLDDPSGIADVLVTSESVDTLGVFEVAPDEWIVIVKGSTAMAGSAIHLEATDHAGNSAEHVVWLTRPN